MSTLSLLSRGNAQLVKTTQEKLEVHYEPEDYFNWRSYQVFHTRRFLNGTYASHGYLELPTPKTFSTRRGALVLYSEDLALRAWYGSRAKRGQRDHRRKSRELKLELNTLRDLTGAILSYGRKQRGNSESHWRPYLHFLSEDETQANKQIRPGYSPKRYLTRLFQTWDPNIIYRLQQAGSLRDSVQLQQVPTSTAQISRRHPDLSSIPLKYQCPPVLNAPHLPSWTYTDVFTGSGRCTPVQEEPENEEAPDNDMEIAEKSGETSAIPAHTGEAQRKVSPEPGEPYEHDRTWNRRARYDRSITQKNLEGDDEMTNRSDEYFEKSPFPLAFYAGKNIISAPHGKPHTTFYGGSFSGTKKYQCVKQDQWKQELESEELLPGGRFLPRIPQPQGQEPGVSRDKGTKVHKSVQLPSIFDDVPQAPQHKRRFHATETPKELIIIPLLVHFQNQQTNREEKAHRREAAEEVSKNQALPKERVAPPLTNQAPISVPERRIKTIQMDIDWNVAPTTDGDILAMPDAPPLGSLPPINGRKGPGHQSSLPSSKVPPGGNSTSTAIHKTIPSGIIRGSIPEELKECCKGSSVGSLIMSPNGEIVCLSLVGAARDTDIPIQFDFIPEEEEDDDDDEDEEEECLESEDREEHWLDDDPDSEQGIIGSSSPSIHIPTDSWEEETTPEHHNEKRVTASIERGFPSTHNTITFPHTVLSSTILSGRASRIKEQDGISAEIGLFDPESPGRVSPSEMPSPEVQSQSPGRITPTMDLIDVLQPETVVHQKPTDADKKSDPKESKKGNKTARQNTENKADVLGTKPELQKPSLTKENTFKEQKPRKQQITKEETQDNEMTSTPSVQVEDRSNEQAENATSKQQTSKQKTSEKREKVRPQPKGKNTENSVNVDKTTGKEPSVTIPGEEQETARETTPGVKQGMTEEEEMAILEKITSSMKKEASKVKGKKKIKSEKTPKPAATGAKRAKQGQDKQPGRAAFVVGQPKEKKPEGTSYPRRDSMLLERPDTILEGKDSDYEEEEELVKGSAGQLVEETQESSTPREPKDMSMANGDDETSKDNDLEIPSPRAEQSVSDGQDVGRVPDLVSSLVLHSEDDYTPSEISVVTNNSQRKQKALRNRELSDKAERRRIEVENKRREREEQLCLEKEREERLSQMEEELEQEQRRRAEELRLKKQQEEQEKQRLEQEKIRRMQLEQQALERARLQQEEYRKKLQDLQRRKQQEETERIEYERQRQKEKELLEAEERRKMLEMADDEREEYKRKKLEMEERARHEEEERRKRAEAEAKAIMEEAQRQAQLLARQAAALEQQLQFNRGLMAESTGLDQTQSVSRAWVFSYFEFLELLGLPLPVQGE